MQATLWTNWTQIQFAVLWISHWVKDHMNMKSFMNDCVADVPCHVRSHSLWFMCDGMTSAENGESQVRVHRLWPNSAGHVLSIWEAYKKSSSPKFDPVSEEIETKENSHTLLFTCDGVSLAIPYGLRVTEWLSQSLRFTCDRWAYTHPTVYVWLNDLLKSHPTEIESLPTSLHTTTTCVVTDWPIHKSSPLLLIMCS